MAIIELNDADFDQKVQDSSTPILVDFRADWCGPCRQLEPALEELSNELAGRITVASVDIDSNPNAPSKLGVRGIPALFIFKNGEVVAESSGARPKSSLRKWIEDAIE